MRDSRSALVTTPAGRAAPQPVTMLGTVTANPAGADEDRLCSRSWCHFRWRVANLEEVATDWQSQIRPTPELEVRQPLGILRRHVLRRHVRRARPAPQPSFASGRNSQPGYRLAARHPLTWVHQKTDDGATERGADLD